MSDNNTPLQRIDADPIALDRRQSAKALEICRGVLRLLANHGIAGITEATLASGRRADIIGVAADGEVWIIEIKSSLEDFRGDRKWPEYREYCDRLLFAVATDFPAEILPEDTGLVIADRYGGEIVREAPVHRLAAARRKALTLRIARVAALRLAGFMDAGAALEAQVRE